MVDNLIKVLVDSNISSDGSDIKHAGRKYSSHRQHLLIKHLNKSAFITHGCPEFLAKSESEQTQLLSEACDRMNLHKRKELTENMPNFGKHKRSFEHVREYYRMYYKLDGHIKDPAVIVDHSAGEITSMSFNTYRKYFSKEELEMFEKVAPIVDTVFNPKETRRIYEDEERGYHILNSYIAPTFLERIEKLEKKKPKFTMPPHIKRFLKFFTNEDNAELDNLLLWVYECVFKRSPTYLCLISDPGSGKTTIFGGLVHRLVGLKNFTPTKSDFNKNNFNQFLDKTLYVLLDEFECLATRDKDNLKRIQNDIIQIEGKGSNQRTIENKCSFVICNNEMDAIHQDPLDRKFFFPKITNNKILTTLGQGFIDELMKEMDSDEALAHFYLFLRDRTYSYPSTELIPKNHWHEEIILATAPSQIKGMLKSFINKEIYMTTYQDAKDQFLANKNRNAFHFLGEFKFFRYFRNFTWHGKSLFHVEGEKVYLLNDEGETYFKEAEAIEMPGE